MDWKNFNLKKYLEKIPDEKLNLSQKDSLNALNIQLKHHGAIIADEVGTGKTRIACALIDYIYSKEGRTAVVIPRGLITQWINELSYFTEIKPIIIINYRNLIDSFTEITTTNRPVFISQTFRFPIIKSGAPEWKFIFLALVLYLKKKDQNFDEQRNFARGKATKFIKKSKEDNQKTNYFLIEWAKYFVKNDYLFYNQQMRTLSQRYPFNFGDEANFKDNQPGRDIMLTDVIPKMFNFFNLIIIDEAHKGKGYDSTINNIMKFLSTDNIKNQRILGMTATPIELHENQWINLLQRINVEENVCNELSKTITSYSNAFKSLTNLKYITENEVLSFKNISMRFEDNLGKYVTRRKKEIDPRYLNKIGNKNKLVHPHRSYRGETIKISDLNSHESKKWVFLHECLSKSSKGINLKRKNKNDLHENNSNDIHERIKRLDTYFSRGHNIKNFNVEEAFSEESKNKINDINDRFKFERAKYFAQKWVEINQPLYKHPRVRKAIEIIESYADKNEKILVFGCFTGPIKTLECCLNARYILKNFRDGKIARIPESFFDTEEQKQIFAYEAKNLKITKPSKSQINENVKKYENLRNKIRERVEYVLTQNEISESSDGDETHIFEKIKKLITARATDVVIYSDISSYDQLIEDLLREVILDSKAVNENSDDEILEKEDDLNIKKILSLVSDKALSGSEFSMLLDGGTEFTRRSVIQTEFNRKTGFPRVLIAQSQVGKEGLNLHKACSTVLLFNADWNPGVIEQQIGRVDRLNSLWEERKNEWLKNTEASDPPVIEIIELHFDGTYDQAQWEKLKERKQTLLYHLYNSVDTNNNWSPETESKVLEIMPNFSPKKFLERNK